MIKTCTGCGAEKRLDEFHVERRGLHGRRGECKACISAKRRARYRSDPETYRERSRLRQRYARLQSAEGSHTDEEWELLLATYDGRCAACDTAEGVGRDHVIPLSAGGTDFIGNVQPLCVSCNSKKGTRIIDYRRAGVFPTLAETVAEAA